MTTAERGVALVVEELERRGLGAVRAPQGRSRDVVEATRRDGSTVSIDVKSRTGGTWQTQHTDGRANPEPDPTRVVVFVDLAPARPRFYVVPRDEYEREVHLEHAAYIRRSGERLPAGSKHHAVVTSSVQDWHARWDLITGPPRQHEGRDRAVDDVVVDVRARPATFATRGERDAVAAAIGTREVPDDVRFEVAVEFRLPVPVTANDAWDLDNLVKPTLDALGGVIGWRRRGGVPQADDERIDRLVASKRPEADDEPGATIRIVTIPSDYELITPVHRRE